jgi:hypothetical protein
MTQAVISFMLIGLVLYQIAMISFLYLTKAERTPAILIGVMLILTCAIGFYLVVFYFKRIKKCAQKDVNEEEIDLEWFRDAYLHPGLKNQSDVFDESDITVRVFDAAGVARSRTVTSSYMASMSSSSTSNLARASSPHTGYGSLNDSS